MHTRRSYRPEYPEATCPRKASSHRTMLAEDTLHGSFAEGFAGLPYFHPSLQETKATASKVVKFTWNQKAFTSSSGFWGSKISVCRFVPVTTIEKRELHACPLLQLSGVQHKAGWTRSINQEAKQPGPMALRLLSHAKPNSESADSLQVVVSGLFMLQGGSARVVRGISLR